jgi:poly-gamma-glutamate synthesis protein (capsule biosynthesis protein)
MNDEIRILFAGDYFPNGRVANLFNRCDYESVLKEVRGINSTVDYSVVNFECNIATEDDDRIKKSGPSLCAGENSMDALSWAGFNMICLANNHFRDFGDKPVVRTIECAKKRNIDVVGGGVNIDEASKILYCTIKGRKIAFINACETEFSIASKHAGGSNPLNPIAQYYSIKEARDKADNVFVIIHGGHEHCQEPSFRMRQTYRFFIDAGADAVINHHQHCFLGYEIYHDRPIFYGLGNFCFDKLNDRMPESWHFGYLVILNMSENITFDIVPYEQCGEKPSVHFLEDKSLFIEKLDNLNQILADDKRLEEYLHHFYDSHPIIDVTIPLLGRFWCRLRPYIKKHINSQWYYHLKDYLFCESHRDRLEYEIGEIIEMDSKIL